MVSATYYCPYCGALTGIERDASLADKCVTPEPLEGWEYASTTEEYEDSAERSSADHSSGRNPREEADGIEFVCLGDISESADSEASRNRPDSGAADEGQDGCGRTFYLSYVKFERGEEVEPRVPVYDGSPSFGFLR